MAEGCAKERKALEEWHNSSSISERPCVFMQMCFYFDASIVSLKAEDKQTVAVFVHWITKLTHWRKSNISSTSKPHLVYIAFLNVFIFFDVFEFNRLSSVVQYSVLLLFSLQGWIKFRIERSSLFDIIKESPSSVMSCEFISVIKGDVWQSQKCHYVYILDIEMEIKTCLSRDIMWCKIREWCKT